VSVHLGTDDQSSLWQRKAIFCTASDDLIKAFLKWQNTLKGSIALIPQEIHMLKNVCRLLKSMPFRFLFPARLPQVCLHPSLHITTVPTEKRAPDKAFQP